MFTPFPGCKPLITIGAFGLMVFTGCSSGPERHGRADGAPSPAMGLASLSMTAQDTFFSNTITVEANLGHGFGSGSRGGGGPGGGQRGGAGGGGRRRHRGGG